MSSNIARQESAESPVVIGLTGFPGAGKDTVIHHLISNYGPFAPEVHVGSIVRERTDKARARLSRRYPFRAYSREEVEGAISTRRRERRPGWPATWVLDKISGLLLESPRHVVVNAVNTLSELETYRASLSNFILIGVLADKEEAIQRALRRSERPITRDELEQRWDRESSQGKPDVIARADFTITNDGDFSGLTIQVDDMVRYLIARGFDLVPTSTI